MALPSLTAPKGVNPEIYAKVRAQAVELEGVFLNTLTKEMFSSVDTSEQSFGGGFGEETWRSMQAESLADTIARSGGIGLADALMPDLLAAQGQQPPFPSVAKGFAAYDRR